MRELFLLGLDVWFLFCFVWHVDSLLFFHVNKTHAFIVEGIIDYRPCYDLYSLLTNKYKSVCLCQQTNMYHTGLHGYCYIYKCHTCILL